MALLSFRATVIASQTEHVQPVPATIPPFLFKALWSLEGGGPFAHLFSTSPIRPVRAAYAASAEGQLGAESPRTRRALPSCPLISIKN